MVVVFGTVASNASPGGDLFEMDMSSGAQTLAGFDSERTSDSGVTFTKSYQATGGPGGTPAYRITSLHDAAQAATGASVFWGGEYYSGWNVDVGAAPASGDTRYTRFYVRVLGGSNFRFINSQDGTQPEPGGCKLIIVGDGESGRTIVETNGDPDVGSYSLRLARDGGNYGTYSASLDTWYAIQVRTVTGPSGSVAMWVNNDDVNSPDFDSGSTSMGFAAYDGIGFGYYQNRMVTNTGTYTYELAGLQYATAFDPAWYSGMGA